MAAKPIPRLRLKLLAWGLGATAVGIGLIVLSRLILSASAGEPAATQPVAATQPAAVTQPAASTQPTASTQPASETPHRRSARQVAAQNLSNMLIFCSLLSFTVAVVAFVWLGVEIRRAAVPAWKRHPKKRW